MDRRGKWAAALLVAGAFGGGARSSFAESTLRPGVTRGLVGDALDALPGYHRVPLLRTGGERLAVGGSIGYGVTEALPGDAGAHHRLGGSLSVAGAALPWLELGADARFRHDSHPADRFGADDGAALELGFKSRAAWIPLESWRLGAGLAYWLPAADRVEDALTHPGFDITLHGNYLPRNAPFTLAALCGLRLDHSSGLRPTPPLSFRQGDRIASNLSDSHALLVGAGGSYRIARTVLFAETTVDALVGDRAPSFGQSPLRVAFGGRYLFDDALSLGVTSEVSLSARPPLGVSDPLVPIEPRFGVLASFAYRLLDQRPRARPAPVSQPRPAPSPKPALPVTGSVSVRVFTLSGDPLSDAQVSLEREGQTHEVPHENLETYGLSGVPAGKMTVVVRAKRLREARREVELVPGVPLVVEARLEPALDSGQVRGLVRSFGGQGLVAKIVVEPTGQELDSAPDGTFSLDVAPGRYQIEIRAPGFVPQSRSVSVERDGVTILNADLVKAPPGQAPP